MAERSISDRIASKVSALASSERHNPTVSNIVSTDGASSVLTSRFTLGQRDPSDFYDGPGIGVEAPTNIPVVYGQVMISGTVVDGGEVRSDLDPDRVLKKLRIITGEGPNFGIPGSTDNEQLQNTIIGCKPVIDRETGKANFGDVVLRSVLGATANAVIPPLMESIVGAVIGEDDPVTGKPIESLVNGDRNPTAMKLGDLSDVTGGGSKHSVLTYDNETCKWVSKHIDDVLADANPDVFVVV